MPSLDFDASSYEPSDFALLEAGDYEAIVVESDKKPTSTGGSQLVLKLQIVSGPAKNRTVFDRMNLWNKSDQAVAIARGQFSALCRAVGVLSPSASEELHNKVLIVKIATEKRKDNGEIRNVVKGYKAHQSAEKREETVSARPW